MREFIKKHHNTVPSLLFISHKLGGGSQVYLQEQIKSLKQDNLVSVIKTVDNQFQYELFFQETKISAIFNNLAELELFLESINFNKIYINQLSSFQNLDLALQFIKKISDKKQSKIILLMHDFYCLCKNIHLMDGSGKYCQVINGKECNCKNGKDHCQIWSEFLIKEVDKIICFSGYTKKILLNRIQDLSDKIEIIPHKVTDLRKVQISKTTKTINIATLGVLTKIKGLDVIYEICNLIKLQKLDVKINVVGNFRPTIKPESMKITGPYLIRQLPKIMESNEIDIVFISSICPETFCYTAHEAMQMGLRVACFNIGAQAEYVRQYDKGLIISKIDAQTALEEMIEVLK